MRAMQRRLGAATGIGLLGLIPLVAVMLAGAQPALGQAVLGQAALGQPALGQAAPRQATPPTVSQASSAPVQDVLWFNAIGGMQTCMNPSQVVSHGCGFSGQGTTWFGPVTDGVNAYSVIYSDFCGRVICGAGQVCTLVGSGGDCQNFGNYWFWSPDGAWAMYGGLAFVQPNTRGTPAADIYSCPVSALTNISTTSSTMPAGCSQLDNPGKEANPVVMLAVPDHLYVGLQPEGTVNDGGIVWSCSPTVANSCTNLDNSGSNYPLSFAYGAGYLWVGLSNGILWRCDPDTANACTNWAKFDYLITSLALDGMGSIYASLSWRPGATGGFNRSGSVYECSVATATSGACPEVISGVFGKTQISAGSSIAAGPGGVFAMTACGYGTQSGGVYFGSTEFANSSKVCGGSLLFVPAGGIPGTGTVQVSGPRMTSRSQARGDVGVCLAGGRITLRFQSLDVDRPDIVRTASCRKVVGAHHHLRVGAIDAGQYRLVASSGKHASQEFTLTVVKDRTTKIRLVY